MPITCLLCSAPIEITPTDLAFYEKVSPVFNGKKELITPPTLCPDCRNRRRMAWRNDRTFYSRTCDLTKEKFISIYPADAPFPVYKPSAWYGDGWDPLKYGMDLDLTRPFFEQFAELQKKVPRLGIDIVNCQNSEYCNYCGDDKNCYLDIAGEANEDCFFNLFIKYCKDCTDCTFCYHSTLCYESLNCEKCYNVRYSSYLDDCSDCTLCFDMRGCRNCALSINLRNKEYHILNQPHTKKEYEKKMKELNMGSAASREKVFALWQKMRISKGIYRDMYNVSCENCVGNDIRNSKNCERVFNAVNCEDCKYLNDVLDAKDCQDLNYSLYKPEASYELISTLAMRFSAWCVASHYCATSFYCDMVNNSSDLFGCIGLNHKKHCFLNKQYTKEEYDALVPKIIDQMRKNGSGPAMNQSPSSGSWPAMNPSAGDASGSWGEFFPASISSFAYNETVAQEYYPLSKDQATGLGFRWMDRAKTEPKPATAAVADHIRDVPESIVKETLACATCKKNYRLTAQELKFYRQSEVPVPRKCPDCRHSARLALRNPRKLWSRACAKCQKPIATSFAPERPEFLYCEQCYLKEVY